MIHADLFSGICGFSLAAEWAGWETAFHCENDPWCRGVIRYQFPNTTLYEDIKSIDFRQWRDKIDVLSGGFPCQPYSIAGKRKGDRDDRHLWPEMRRAIREIRPRWAVGENVLGIVNWEGGLVFEQVCSDLEKEGYEVQPYILPACGVNAPHRRHRTFFVGHRVGSKPTARTPEHVDDSSDMRIPGKNTGKSRKERLQEHYKVQHLVQSIGARPPVELLNSDCSSEQSAWSQYEQQKLGGKRQGKLRGNGFGIGRELKPGRWKLFPSVSPVRVRDDGLSDWMDDSSILEWQNNTIKAAGNAVVPELVFRLFDTINKYEKP